MVSRRKKHVLMLIENNPLRRDVRVRQEAEALIQAGYRVSVISPGIPGQGFHETFNGIDLYSYPSPYQGRGFVGYAYEYGYSLAVMFALTTFLFFRRGFDVIHAANPPDISVFIGMFFKLFGKKYVFDHHDLSPEIFKVRFGTEKRITLLVYRILLFLERLSCRVADRVVATNQSYKSIEMNRTGIPAEKIAVVRNGPALERLKPVEPSPGLQRAGKTTLVYLGIMGFQDGVDHLLDALHLLVQELKRMDFFCVIAGGGDALPSLKEQTSRLGLDEFVIFTGFVEPDQVAAYISAADICVAPETSSPLNDHSTIIKILEYMALGKPIVAYDLPEHRISAQGAALFAPSGNDLDFARKIAALMDDPIQRDRIGRVGRERIEKELAWTHQARHLVATYADMIGPAGS